MLSFTKFSSTPRIKVIYLPLFAFVKFIILTSQRKTLKVGRTEPLAPDHSEWQSLLKSVRLATILYESSEMRKLHTITE